MDRVEFISKTCVDDSSKEAILEHFWNQYMLLYGLAGSVEEVMVLAPLNICAARIDFRLTYKDKDSMLRASNVINQNRVVDIYEGKYNVIAQVPDPGKRFIVDVTIQRFA